MPPKWQSTSSSSLLLLHKQKPVILEYPWRAPPCIRRGRQILTQIRGYFEYFLFLKIRTQVTLSWYETDHFGSWHWIWLSMIKELKDGVGRMFFFFCIVKYLEVQVEIFIRFYWLLSVMNCRAKLQELQRAAKDNQRQDPQRSEVSCEESRLQGNSLQLDLFRIRSTLCKAEANSLNLLPPFVILLTFGTCWSREFPLQQLTVKVDVRMSTQASSPKQFRGLLWLGRIRALIELLHSASCSVRSLA